MMMSWWNIIVMIIIIRLLLHPLSTPCPRLHLQCSISRIPPFDIISPLPLLFMRSVTFIICQSSTKTQRNSILLAGFPRFMRRSCIYRRRGIRRNGWRLSSWIGSRFGLWCIIVASHPESNSKSCCCCCCCDKIDERCCWIYNLLAEYIRRVIIINKHDWAHRHHHFRDLLKGNND